MMRGLLRRPFALAQAGFVYFAQISTIFFLKLCAKLRLDFFPKLWYNNSVKRRGEVAPGPTWCEGFDSLG